MLLLAMNDAARVVVYSMGAVLIAFGALPMRFLIPCQLASLILVAQPSAAQDKDKSVKDRRIAEIQKEVRELEGRIARLQAELLKLQLPVKPGPPDLAPADKTMKGIIKSVNDRRDQFYLVNGGPKDDEILIGLTADAHVEFSDKKPAKLADLKPGRSVTLRY
jgi:hypothetical protein